MELIIENDSHFFPSKKMLDEKSTLHDGYVILPDETAEKETGDRYYKIYQVYFCTNWTGGSVPQSNRMHCVATLTLMDQGLGGKPIAAITETGSEQINPRLFNLKAPNIKSLDLKAFLDEKIINKLDIHMQQKRNEHECKVKMTSKL